MHKIVSEAEWFAARKSFLAKEKEFTRLRDELARQRRELPWVKVEKAYMFDGPDGKESLSDLFAGRGQLVVNHFMFGPDWNEGCPSCSFWADTYNGIVVHLEHRDASFVAVSRAPLEKLEAYKKRMGWSFKWVSSLHTDFNRDYHVSFTPEEQKTAVYNYAAAGFGSSEAPGVSVFAKDERGQRLPYLLLLRARPGHAQRRLSAARHPAQGARRAGPALPDGVGAPPRQIRSERGLQGGQTPRMHASHLTEGIRAEGSDPLIHRRSAS